MAGVVRIASAGLLLLIATFGASAIVRAYDPIDSSDINVCYRSDGERIETSYIDTGATSYYPIESSSSVEQVGGDLVARHEVRFEWRGKRVYVPWVTR